MFTKVVDTRGEWAIAEDGGTKENPARPIAKVVAQPSSGVDLIWITFTFAVNPGNPFTMPATYAKQLGQALIQAAEMQVPTLATATRQPVAPSSQS